MIFVVDAASAARMDEVASVFADTLAEPMAARKPILVFANKQDLPGCWSAAELASKLGLDGANVHAAQSRTRIALCTALPASREVCLYIHF